MMRILVVGCGQMGRSHTLAYRKSGAFEIVGLVSRGESRHQLAPQVGHPPTFTSFEEALKSTQPDVVSINTYPDTHAAYAIAALKAGAHVFVEKPLATTVKEAQEVVQVANQMKRKLLVGYILRHHPSWQRFIELARDLGKPLTMRLNLNQQTDGSAWEIHKKLMHSVSPIVDCGVHYVDVMCQITGAQPVAVNGMGARLSDEIAPDMYNYGQLQVAFDDGSVGWYEAAWGPMISETAHFIKDVSGPKGSVSMRKLGGIRSSDICGHTSTNRLILHSSTRDASGRFSQPDQIIDTSTGPTHDALCEYQSTYFIKAITQNLDLSAHHRDAINSLAITLAAHDRIRTMRLLHRTLLH